MSTNSVEQALPRPRIGNRCRRAEERQLNASSPAAPRGTGFWGAPAFGFANGRSAPGAQLRALSRWLCLDARVRPAARIRIWRPTACPVWRCVPERHPHAGVFAGGELPRWLRSRRSWGSRSLAVKRSAAAWVRTRRGAPLVGAQHARRRGASCWPSQERLRPGVWHPRRALWRHLTSRGASSVLHGLRSRGDALDPQFMRRAEDSAAPSVTSLRDFRAPYKQAVTSRHAQVSPGLPERRRPRQARARREAARRARA